MAKQSSLSRWRRPCLTDVRVKNGYGKGVSPISFFRKKRSQPVEKVAEPSATSPIEATASPSLDNALPVEPERPAPALDRSLDEETDAAYAAITEAFAQWRESLSLKTDDIVLSADEPTVLDLSSLHPTGAAQFYSGSPTPLTSVFRESETQGRARTKINALLEKQRSLEESYGSAPISLVMGTLTWSEIRPKKQSASEPEPGDNADDVELGAAFDETGQISLDDAEEVSEEPTGPQVIEVTEPALRRVVHVVASTAADPVLTLGHEADISSSVLGALRRHGAPVEAVAEIRTLAHDPETQESALARLRELARVYLPGCEYRSVTLLALASSPSAILHDDLVTMEPRIRGSRLIARLVSETPSNEQIEADPYDRSPQEERGAGQLDVTELDIVDAVAGGTSVFIDSAPGTSPRRVLASIASDIAASGKSVLYLYGNSSAHRAFTGQLNIMGLGDLVADFGKVSEVPMRLRTGMRLKSPTIDAEAVSERNAQLESDREALVEFMSALHETSPKWGVSAYQLLTQIVEMSLEEDGAKTKVRFSEDVVTALSDEEARGRAAARLDEALRLDRRASESNPWARSTIFTGEDATAAHKRVTHLADISLPALLDQVQRASAETGLRKAETLNDWAEQLELLSEVSDTLDTFRPHIYERSVADMLIATASKEWRNSHGATMGMSERRHLKKEARDMVRAGQEVTDLHASLSKVQREREQWRLLAEPGSWPSIPEGMSQLRSTYGEVRAEIDEVMEFLPDGGELTAIPLAELRKRCQALARESGDLADLPRRNSLRGEVEKDGLTELYADLTDRSIPADKAGSELHAAHLASVFEHMFSSTHALAAGAGTRANDLVARVVQQDREHVESMPQYINRAVVSNMRSKITKKKDQTLEVDSYLAEHGAAGLRDAIARHGELLQAARPVWAMSAVTVAQFIPPMKWADVVILDGIDNVELAQLVPAILRGGTLVVAGRLQSRGEAVSALSKILPVASLPTLSSKHDEMTASFLSSNGFSTALAVYPGAPTRPMPKLKVVEGTGVPGPKSGLVEGPEKEVEAVVEAVVDLALSRPGESVGVISLNAAHAERIRASIRSVARTSSALGDLTDPTVKEPFTVVDAMSNTALRRDHIILTVGLGKTVHGRVLHSFGDLSTPAGVEGLVSALESPRKSLTMISSFEASDIDRNRLGTPGSILLVDLLEAYRKQAPAEDPAEGEGNALLRDLALRLQERGYRARVGYRRGESLSIPLVAGHDEIPGTWATAVTIDNERYAEEKSLRRRDQFWPAMLSGRGWRVVPTVTTSVFFDPQAEIERIISSVDAVRDEVRQAASRKKTGKNIPAHLDLTTIDDDLDEPQGRPRGPRPKVSPGMPLAAYSDDQLDDLVAWIISDGKNRSEDEVVDALRSELDLRRRGIQVDVVLRNVVRRQVGPAVVTSENGEEPGGDDLGGAQFGGEQPADGDRPAHNDEGDRL